MVLYFEAKNRWQIEIFDFLAYNINNKNSFFDVAASCSSDYLNLIRYLRHIGIMCHKPYGSTRFRKKFIQQKLDNF